MKGIKLLLISIFICFGPFSLFAQSQWPTESRTEGRSNAGLQGNEGARSGFFETDQPVNYPPGATSWWHLLDVRHSNAFNNFAMQFSGSFYDQLLYFRKTAGNGAQPWSRILTEIDGKVGIATSQPSAALQIGNFATNSTIKITIPGTYNFEQINLGQQGNGSAYLEFVNHESFDQSYGVKIGADVDKYGSGLYITAALPTPSYATLNYPAQPALFVNRYNDVGIGTNDPKGYRLAVAGNMIAEKIQVKLKSAWPDYVFEENYQLPGLHELEQYIEIHRRLPEIPSAQEVATTGIDVGEMNRKLLQKIEELTLYIIQLKKENEAQQQAIERLQQGH